MLLIGPDRRAFHRVGPFNLKGAVMRKPLLTILVSIFLGSLATAVQAAPQILGVIATAIPVPLICRGETCNAELTTFCLQEWRPTPQLGALYRPFGGDGITLIGHRADGTKVALDAKDVEYETLGGHSSIYAQLPRHILDAGGFVAASVQVGSLVSLLPVPELNDPDPQTELDVQIATGPLRQVGADILHEGDERIAAAGVLNRVINLLPSTEKDTLAAADGGWQRIAGEIPQLQDQDNVKALAQREYAACHAETGAAHMNHDYRLLQMGYCLSSKHDVLVLPKAKQYWATVDAGS